MPAKPVFTESQHKILRDTFSRVWEGQFKGKRRQGDKPGGQEAMALALGVTQQTISNWIHGTYKPSVKVARSLANLAGQTLEQLVGEIGVEQHGETGAMPAGVYPNLKTCVDFYSSKRHWSAWTIAAAKSGYYGASDYEAPEWASKLDALEKLLEKGRKLV